MVTWKLREDGSKPPRTVDGSPSWKDPARWAKFTDAKNAAGSGGVGYVLNGGKVAVIDLDDCIDDDRRVADWACAIIKMCGGIDNVWIELSPSGHGLHIIGRTRRDARFQRAHDHGEVYVGKHYVTVTGWEIGSGRHHLAVLDDAIDHLLADDPQPRETVEDDGDIIADKDRSILEKYRAKLRSDTYQDLKKRGMVGKGDQKRPRVELKRTCELLEAGVPKEDALAIMKASRWNKYRGRADEDHRLSETWAEAARRTKPKESRDVSAPYVKSQREALGDRHGAWCRCRRKDDRLGLARRHRARQAVGPGG